MRIAGIEKMGYYPTPPVTLQLLTRLLRGSPGSHLRLLDPCAGKGEALAAVSASLRGQGAQPESYGVELSAARYVQAAALLDHTLCADWWDVTTRRRSYALLWLNPPYDWEGGQKEGTRQRMEYRFLQASIDKLAPGGVLVYLVPRSLLSDSRAMRLLSAHCEQLTLWRLPDGEYATFQQVVCLGVQRARPCPDDSTAAWLHAYATEQLPPPLDEAAVEYHLSPVAVERFLFRKSHLSPEEAADLCARHGVHSTNTWQDFQRVESAAAFRPITPLRRGHLAMLLASGLMGTTRLPGGLVAKGRAVKVVETVEGQPAANQTRPAESEILREKFVTRVITLDSQGGYQIIEQAAKLEAFLETHGGHMARLIQQRHQPLYDQPTPQEWQALDGLLPDKRLPGRSLSGLLDAQRHVAIAAARAIRSRGHAHLVAEMGFGKSASSLATARLLDDWPVLVLCPGHLVGKWQREVEQTIPGAQGVILDSLADLWQLAERYQPGHRVAAILSKERAKLGPGWRHATVQRHVVAGERTSALACPACGAILTDSDNLPITYEELGNKRRTCVCGEPLYQFEGLHRWPLADAIRRKLPGFFRLLIADEVHNFKAKSSDQGRAFQHLVQACGRTLTLTGTFFGGKSTSLFWLLYRLDGEVRRAFAFHDESRWSQIYGRLEWTVQKESAQGDGVFAGNRRHLNRARELPGIAPQIVQHVLPGAIFAKVADLGYEMPAYSEEIVRLTMTTAQKEQVGKLDRDLRHYMEQGRQNGDVGWVSVWLQNCLARPNACFRPEWVTRHRQTREGKVRETVCKLEAVTALDELLPKEAWLVDFCRTETAQARKVLVYVRQTGERDIQPRLVQLLSRAGLRAQVLPASLVPARREGWIAAHAGVLDVLVVNPRKVETGLDLVEFATCIFFEIEYSLYTLWQAMRRVWRLGQTQAVKVVYAVYQETLEEAALALMGEKLKAALLLYGDNAASAITEECDDGDFLATLAQRVLAGEQLAATGLSGLLKPDTRTTTRTWGSPTQESVRLEPLPQELRCVQLALL